MTKQRHWESGNLTPYFTAIELSFAVRAALSKRTIGLTASQATLVPAQSVFNKHSMDVLRLLCERPQLMPWLLKAWPQPGLFEAVIFVDTSLLGPFSTLALPLVEDYYAMIRQSPGWCKI